MSRANGINLRLAVAADLLKQSAAIALRHFRQPLIINAIKADDSKLQLSVDVEIECFLHHHLAEAFAEDGWWGEETGQQPGASPFVWMVDPIDGTASFAMGKPTFTTTMALLYEGRSVAGLIFQPYLNELMVATAGQGAYLNRRRVQVNALAKRLAIARVCTNPPYLFQSSQQRRVLMELAQQALAVEYGGDAYNYGLLAAGYLDAVIACGEAPYDFTMAIPIIQEAGGCITDWHGQLLQCQQPSDLIASSQPDLHADLLALVKACLSAPTSQ